MNREKVENIIYFFVLWFSISIIVLGLIGTVFSLISK